MTPAERALYLANHQVWHPQIGDPSVLGWATVAAYGVAAALSGLAAGRAGRAGVRGEAAIWGLFAAALAFLCVNKQLDLQSWVTIAGRDLAVEQGWFHHRRPAQLVGVVAVCVTGVAGVVVLLRKTRGLDGWLRVALAGLAFIAIYVVIRAASFSHIDHFIASGPHGVRWNWILELGGIAVTAFAAWRYRPSATLDA